jgi:CRISPR-associated endoribonuclease Cas6
MRLRLTIRPLQKPCSITLNYNYYLSSAIYRWIEASSPEYSALLHERGFQPEGMMRRFKHFCFSQLMVEKRQVREGRLHILSPIITWYVGMPVEESLQHFVFGLFEKQHFFIELPDIRFAVEQVEALPEPVWTSPMRFRMLSPVTVSVPIDRTSVSPDGRTKLSAQYLLPDDPHLSEALRNNIINKYNSLCDSGSQSEPQDSRRSNNPGDGSGDSSYMFSCRFDEKFITDRGGPGKITKLITIRERQEGETKVRGFMCPLTIEGDVRLIRLAYESGLGEKNSMGFGMIEYRVHSAHPFEKQHSSQTAGRR